MEKNRKRALRRHHAERMHQHALRIIREYWYYGDQDEEWAQWASRRWRDHLKVCSCWSCGNPRRYLNELTRAELKANDSSRDAIDTLDLEKIDE